MTAMNAETLLRLAALNTEYANCIDADRLEEWFKQRACDGFIFMPVYLPGALDDFVDQVIAELQRRGLFRKEYETSTLREHLGLKRPQSVYARRATAAARQGVA